MPAPGSDLIGNTFVVNAKDNETLADISRRFDVGYHEIQSANPRIYASKRLNSATQVVVPGSIILPPGPREGIVINLAELRIFYFPSDHKSVYTFPIGIGREGGWSTPEGETIVTAKEEFPEWHPTDHVRAEAAKNGYPIPKLFPAGPDNPLGDYLLRLRWPTYLIHGTNQVDSVGGRVSAGCIRLFPRAIKELYPLISVGTKVRVINVAYKTGWHNGALYVEAHTPLIERMKYRQQEAASTRQAVIREAKSRHANVNWDRFKQIMITPTGIPISVTA